MSLEEIELFFREYPELKRTVNISANTPLPTVVYYLAIHSEIKDLTEELSESLTETPVAVARTGLSDIYCLSLSDTTKVAVKCLRQHDPKLMKRTARELNVWSKLKHRNILKLQGLAVFQNCLAMVSPWMKYGSVNSVLGQWPDMKRLPFCLQLAHAVEYLHGKQVVHGDIKGDNLLMEEDGTLKLADFGLAITQEKVFQFSQTDPGGGTTRWMAPELYSDDPQRSRETDVWAMGMTMLEIITGEMPYREIKSAHSVSWAVAHERRIPQVPELEAETASAEDTIMLGLLKSCWKYDPSKRPDARRVTIIVDGLLKK